MQSLSGGEILYDGMDLTKLTEKQFCQIRGKRIAMVFQDPLSALNPIMKVGKQITETLRIHQNLSHEEARKSAIELMGAVGIPEPEKRFNQYPFQFSGGMRQRIVIVIALACNPEILICDEPTTALDVTIQSKILDLIKALKNSEIFPLSSLRTTWVWWRTWRIESALCTLVRSWNLALAMTSFIIPPIRIPGLCCLQCLTVRAGRGFFQSRVRRPTCLCLPKVMRLRLETCTLWISTLRKNPLSSGSRIHTMLQRGFCIPMHLKWKCPKNCANALSA